MHTGYLLSGVIVPIEHGDWNTAFTRFNRIDKDRRCVDEYKEHIRTNGSMPPIELGVSDRYPDVYVRDGQHRAVAVMELGIEWFPFVWSWITSWGKQPLQADPFPYDLVGIT
jgi:hypothetical protein